MNLKRLVVCALILLYGTAVWAADLVPSGAVAAISGPKAVRIGEKLTGVTVTFAAVTKPHTVTLRWVDAKGRICESADLPIAPPANTLRRDFTIANPIGYDHRV